MRRMVSVVLSLLLLCAVVPGASAQSTVPFQSVVDLTNGKVPNLPQFIGAAMQSKVAAQATAKFGHTHYSIIITSVTRDNLTRPAVSFLYQTDTLNGRPVPAWATVAFDNVVGTPVVYSETILDQFAVADGKWQVDITDTAGAVLLSDVDTAPLGVPSGEYGIKHDFGACYSQRVDQMEANAEVRFQRCERICEMSDGAACQVCIIAAWAYQESIPIVAAASCGAHELWHRSRGE